MKKKYILLLFTVFIALYSCKEKDDNGNSPTCSITKPGNGTRFLVGQNISVAVDATDIDNDLAEVRLFLGRSLLSTDTEPPFTFRLVTTGLDSGMYVIKVVAYDQEYNKTSDEISVYLYKDLVVTPIEFVDVQGGVFNMGLLGKKPDDIGDDELPVHSVTVDDFSITKHEITNYHYAQFLNEIKASSNGVVDNIEYIHMKAAVCQIYNSEGVFYSKAGYENFPVVEVSWNGAKAYCEYLGGRLPTEAEWEYAARGGSLVDSTVYSGSNNIEEVAWYVENSAHRTHRVGQKLPNGLGLCDMSGNVWEWCSDWYSSSYYSVSIDNNPQGPDDTGYKVLRGGIFNGDSQFCRLSCRSKAYPLITNNATGFRMVKH